MHAIRFLGYFSSGIIEVSKTSTIPDDYYGVMGVPITALDKIGHEQFEFLDLIRPKLNGKVKYARICMRRKLPPEIEAYMDNGGPFIKRDDDLYIPLQE